MTCCSIRILSYLLSQYLIYVTIMLAFSISQQKTQPHLASERYSSSLTIDNWSDLYDPDYFFHLTDIHITHYIPETIQNFEKALTLASFYQPKTVLITGDLVDNYYLPFYPLDIQETKQIKEDWLNYSSITQKFSNEIENIFETFGNHDIPRIYSKDSPIFYYADYSMLSKKHNIRDTYDIITQKVGNFTFVLLNPIIFPIPPLPLNYYVHATSSFMDRVEQTINSLIEEHHENIIMATHYQGPVWSSYSKESQRIFDILQKDKVKMMISGHNHGKERMVMHHKNDSFEICASDLRYNLMSGLVTCDNDQNVFHWININNPSFSFITYPIPIDQTTSRTNNQVHKVRVLKFNSVNNYVNNFANEEVKVRINGNEIALNKVRPINNDTAWLYEANLNMLKLKDEKHHIELIGEEEESFDFLIGEKMKIEEQQELLYDDMLWAHNQWIGLIILIPLSLFITFPISCLKLENLLIWTLKETNDHSLLYYLLSIFAGFLGIRSRVMTLPLSFRISLFISIIIALFLPIFTYDVEGYFGFMFIFGYFIINENIQFRFEEWCPFLGFFYFGVAIYPMIIGASSLGLSMEKEYWIQIVDLIIVLGSLIGGLVIGFDAFLLLCERKYAFLSPFIIFPLAWIIVFITYFIWRRKNRIKKSSPTAILEFLNHDLDENK
ncbi:hypothetical protein TRFO_33624 [Tritrichomonas foetus]|uniref:Calcineurin-like phosphoesterase domain-containing protein n=1 Tax=Tritrichomonas foetus TaxID=1144522 RepID=A0A1J4JL71_9EUKA|nr:hypothetical protein TRFO_33624 [Tritrichomonas foetus]|eukprot:OHS99834.1 hypothetical protein TRFO_33624 [Tritrichomonas foetus]